ncbi:polyprenol phosphomannose-dependent alpha 1,6 mannosyltransferase MptB [Lentzea sp.]|uniref:polyprenol phosphomannose-dependent alpha 1,6 mannosyltransferase MptB n=1 Tax=Lentzea sp. TaxID=56099 RepID=UPI002C579A5C|nr:polyprenol phosphomannose-dependent alpha 1,6 mannosyltransferase MptB [Lentzea sp.]HUQ57669.1 polyprenol phosphomannose-dependent alpha 1,6 mannosyltransferase MptB [Lentzea sp.]
MQTVTYRWPTGVATGTPELLRWTGFGGALLLTAGAWAARSTAVALGAAIAGAGLVVLTWALLGRTRADPQWSRRTLAWWCGPLLVAPPLFSGDVFSYLAQGEVAARGLDPNVVSPAAGASAEAVARVGVYWRETPSPYGPLFTTVERAITEVTGGNPVAGVVLHRFVAVLGLLLVVWAVPRLAALANVEERAALWLGVLNPLVLWHLVGGVHNDALMLGLMLSGTVIALHALPELRWWQLTAGVVLIGLGAQVKLPALVALAVVGTAVARRLGGGLARFLAAGVSMVVAAVVVSVVTSLAGGSGFGWVRALGTPSKINSWMAPTNWPGFLTGAVSGPEAGQAMISSARIAGLVLILCGLVVIVNRQLRGGVSEVTALGMMMSLIVVLGPVIQPWYLLWAALPLAACLPVGTWRTRVAVLVGVFALLVPPLAGNFSGRVAELVTAYVLGVALVGAAYLVLRRVRVSVAQG